MATYRLEPFDIDITNPTITADVDSIRVKPTQMKIDVQITLTVPGAIMGYYLTDITVLNLEFTGYENLMARVMERIADYEI